MRNPESFPVCGLVRGAEPEIPEPDGISDAELAAERAYQRMLDERDRGREFAADGGY